MLFSRFLPGDGLRLTNELTKRNQSVFRKRECTYVTAKMHMHIMPISVPALKDVKQAEEKLMFQKPEQWVMYLAKYVIEFGRANYIHAPFSRQ